MSTTQDHGRSLTDLLLRASEAWPGTDLLFLAAADGDRSAPATTHVSLLRDAQRMVGGLRARGLRPWLVIASAGTFSARAR